jgi:O-antigen/teichoic acid export membrane protein
LPSALQAVLFTFISTHSDQYLNLQKTIQSTKQIALYAISAGIGGYLLSNYLVVPLFGEAFQASIQCIAILLFGIVPFCLSMPISGYFVATGKVRINLYSAIIGFIICLVADLLLIPQYGIQGAAYASVISYLSTVVFLLAIFYKDNKSIISKF